MRVKLIVVTVVLLIGVAFHVPGQSTALESSVCSEAEVYAKTFEEYITLWAETATPGPTQNTFQHWRMWLEQHPPPDLLLPAHSYWMEATEYLSVHPLLSWPNSPEWNARDEELQRLLDKYETPRAVIVSTCPTLDSYTLSRMVYPSQTAAEATP